MADGHPLIVLDIAHATGAQGGAANHKSCDPIGLSGCDGY
jgi:hypothetical protein